jgi:hypothetical protein
MRDMKKLTQNYNQLIINHLEKTSKISDKYINKYLEMWNIFRIFNVLRVGNGSQSNKQTSGMGENPNNK